jgi:hypothetical protein
LGLPYTTKPINIGRGDQLAPEFLKISPNGRMPAIVDDEPMGGGAPISIFESGPIMMYLAEKTGRFYPQDPRGKYDGRAWDPDWPIASRPTEREGAGFEPSVPRINAHCPKCRHRPDPAAWSGDLCEEPVTFPGIAMTLV